MNDGVTTVDTVRHCRRCGLPNPADASACRTCGASLAGEAGAVAARPSAGSTGPPAPTHLPPGTTLDRGRYRLERVLGRGASGITYRAHDTRLGRPVAIKEMVPPGCARHGRWLRPAGRQPVEFLRLVELRRRFLAEGQTLARFTHPGIVRVYEVLEENGTVYVVMELVTGRTLTQLVAEKGGRLPPGEALALVHRAAQGLGVVHAAGLLHRDLKPDNLVVTDDGRVVLVDFGAARAVAGADASTLARLLTPGYAPLEQYDPDASVGPSSDIYALAATLYELLTGRRPSPAPRRHAGERLVPPHDLAPGVPLAISEAVLWGLELDSHRRPMSVARWLRSLDGPQTSPESGTAPLAPTPTLELPPASTSDPPGSRGSSGSGLLPGPVPTVPLPGATTPWPDLTVPEPPSATGPPSGRPPVVGSPPQPSSAPAGPSSSGPGSVAAPPGSTPPTPQAPPTPPARGGPAHTGPAAPGPSLLPPPRSPVRGWLPLALIVDALASVAPVAVVVALVVGALPLANAVVTTGRAYAAQRQWRGRRWQDTLALPAVLLARLGRSVLTSVLRALVPVVVTTSVAAVTYATIVSSGVVSRLQGEAGVPRELASPAAVMRVVVAAAALVCVRWLMGRLQRSPAFSSTLGADLGWVAARRWRLAWAVAVVVAAAALPAPLVWWPLGGGWPGLGG